MRLRRLLPLLALPAFATAADFPTPFNTEKGAPMPAEEVARTMQLPPGFRCQVFAAEPDVQQPIAMAWDMKGRLWVAENYTYAENPARWDTKLRDRIIILEDKDNDGKHDGRKVFWDQGAYLTSVETGYGGVWILNEGALSFIPDKNGDDVPDGPPQVLLDGFNVKTIGHNIVNGLRWGPDGWLYGRHGITDTSSVGAPGTPEEKRTKLNCAIWRYHPTLRTFEVVCHGGTNSWGHDWDANGELFYINTVIGHLWHGIPGSYSRRMFGTHLNPHVYEVIEQVADHFHWDIGGEKWSDIRNGISNKTLELGGGHAHVGMLIYNGGAWPDKYKGAVLTCNLHGNRINMDTLEREGCSFVGKHAPDFMVAKDKWFRGIELMTGPDGNVFVADWSDSGECHDNDGVHRTSGRIYKISYGETKKIEPERFTQLSKPVKDADELFKLLTSGNRDWWSLMRCRGAMETTLAAAKATTSPQSYMKDAGTNLFLWFNRELGLTLTDDERQAGLLFNVLLNTSAIPGPDVKATMSMEVNGARDFLAARAESTPSGLLRLHLASFLQRFPVEDRWPIATALAKHAEDANDREQPLMIWYGIEPSVAADPMKGVELISVAKIPTVRRLVARRIAEDIEKNPAAVDALVAMITKNEAARGDVLAGMTAGLDGFSSAKKPKGWDEFAAANAKSPSAELLQKLSLVFGSGRAADELIALVKNAEGDANARRNAFTSLTRSPKPDLLPVVRGLINDKVLGTQARSALAAYDDPNIPKALLNPWPGRSQEQQAATVATLSTRPAYAHALLDTIKAGKLPANVISPFQARAIRSLNDDGLTKKLTEVWGELRDTPEAKKAEMEKWTQALTGQALAKGDAVKGKMLFTAACAACHKLYGEGGQIGPDLTGGDRHKVTYLLENILDPNAIVPADYRVSIFKLKDGRTLTGVIPEQNARAITVQTPAERLVIERSQIASQEQMPMSLMPEGLLAALGEEQVIHLFAYLRSTGPVQAK